MIMRTVATIEVMMIAIDHRQVDAEFLQEQTPVLLETLGIMSEFKLGRSMATRYDIERTIKDNIERYPEHHIKDAAKKKLVALETAKRIMSVADFKSIERLVKLIAQGVEEQKVDAFLKRDKVEELLDHLEFKLELKELREGERNDAAKTKGKTTTRKPTTADKGKKETARTDKKKEPVQSSTSDKGKKEMARGNKDGQSNPSVAKTSTTKRRVSYSISEKRDFSERFSMKGRRDLQTRNSISSSQTSMIHNETMGYPQCPVVTSTPRGVNISTPSVQSHRPRNLSNSPNDSFSDQSDVQSVKRKIVAEQPTQNKRVIFPALYILCCHIHHYEELLIVLTVFSFSEVNMNNFACQFRS